MNFSPQQETALRLVAEWKRQTTNPVFMLAGFAGTGKTTLAKEFAANVPGTVYFAAYTGKAAHVLKRAGCPNVSTVHGLIYLPKDRCKAKLRELEAELGELKTLSPLPVQMIAKCEEAILHERANLARPAWTLNTDSPLNDASLLVLDEYSMIDQQMGTDLLSFNCPILALGDPGQLPPIRGEGFFARKPDYMLTEIHRQARDNPIIRLSADVREGGTLRPGQYGDSRVVRYEDLEKEELQALVLGTDQLLVGRNATRQSSNRRARELLGRKEALPETGDKLVCLRNNHKTGLLNGQIWTVEHCDADGAQELFGFLLLRAKNEDGESVQCLAHPNHFLGTADKLDYWTKRDAEEFDYGYALTVHKCVHPDTLVESDQGLLPIRLLSSDGVVATGTTGESYTNLVSNPVGRALQLTCEDGYSITVTPEHKVEVVRQGAPTVITTDSVEEGDWMRVRLGVGVEPASHLVLPPTPRGDVRAVIPKLPTTVTLEFAEFLGLMVADGSLFKRGIRLVKRHRDVALRFGELITSLFGVKLNPLAFRGTTGFEACSTILVAWLKQLGGLEACKKHIPECVLRSSSAVHAAFLRGLFEDGCVNVKEGQCDHIQFTTEYPELARQVQCMLLRLGIISAIPKRVGVQSVYIYGAQAGLFRDRVGFVSKFKQDRLKNCRGTSSRYRVPLSEEQIDLFFARGRSPMDRQNARQYRYVSRTKLRQLRVQVPELEKEIDELLNWHWVRVISVTPTECPSMCITVSPSHRFLQNGFPHGNSQGSQWNNVLLFDEWGGKDRKQWLYTAVTRASERITVVQM